MLIQTSELQDDINDNLGVLPVCAKERAATAIKTHSRPVSISTRLS